MDAMIFAAGLGSRLRPLTDRLPKALVPVAGVPMLERVARRLVAAGADRLIVNVCPFADEIERFVRSRDGFGADVRVSRESPSPLETGGGLLAARAHFRCDAPFFLHNVDVWTDLSLGDLYRAHRRDARPDAGEGEASPLATLAVMDRPTSRRLLFDDLGGLGRVRADGVHVLAREPSGPVASLGFAGVHVVSPAFFDLVTERGAFSVLDPYLRLAGEGRRIAPHRVDGCSWLDVGRAESLREAERLATTRA